MTKILSLFCLISTIGFAQTNTFPSSGNVGIGTTSPSAKLSFNNVSDGSNQADGITWYNPSPLTYGIYRTAGSWAAPDYQQMKLSWETGIILSPGTAYGKSYVDIQGNGLRVTSGNVGIGLNNPSASSKLHLFNASSNTYLNIDKAGNTLESGIQFSSYGSPIFFLWSDNDGTDALKIQAAGLAGEHDGAPRMQFPKANKNIYMGESGGNIGIGTSSPRGKFDVDGSGDIYLSDDVNAGANQSVFLPGHIYISPFNGGNISYLQARRYDNSGTTSLRLRTYNNGTLTEAMHIEGNGNVGIGTTSPNQKLTVNGTIYSKEVKVDLNVPGPDYVFEKDYKLPTLDDIKSYIDANKHLPEVPSAKEMAEKGINLSEMNMILLKKIEELTLQLIQMEERLKGVEKKSSTDK